MGVTIAAFDLAVGSIYDQDGALNMFLPSLKFEVDNNDKITKILVKWYRYDKETNQYIEVTNGNLIKNFVSSLQIVLTDQNGTTGTRIDESINLSSTDSTAIGDTSTTEISQFQNDWYYKGHNVQADLTIDGIVLSVGFSEGIGIVIGF